MTTEVKTEAQAKSSSPDVLLVLPPMYQHGRAPDTNPKEPMGLQYLAAALREDRRRVKIFDADIEAQTVEQTVGRIMRINPPIVGFSVLQRALPSFQQIVEGLRQEGYAGHITCGGITATSSFEPILTRLGDKMQTVVLGEGESIVRKLADRVLTGQDWKNLDGIAYREGLSVVVRKPMDRVDPDALPFASRDYLALCLGKTNYATIMGSRGCYGICTFCSNYAFEQFRGSPHWRGRKPASIVDEMETLYGLYGVTVLKFNDPNIFGPGKEGREHVAEMCREIINRKLPLHLMGFCRGNDITADPKIADLLKQAGFERLLIGVESSDDATLRLFRKGETIRGMEKAIDILDARQISTVVGFMIFNPYTSFETLRRDLSFLRKRGFTPILSKALRAFDGTPIQALLETKGRLIKADPFEGYHNYVMPKDVAAVYGSMKVLFAGCLDRIRAVGQDKIWDVKKAPSFRDRQDFNSLSEAFFGVESELLDKLINWGETGQFSQEDVRQTVARIYEGLHRIGGVISVDIDEVVTPPDKLAKEIYTIMKEQPFNTFEERYSWNAD